MTVRGMEIIYEVMEANDRMAISGSKYYLLSIVETAKNGHTRFYNVAVEGCVPSYLILMNCRAIKPPYLSYALINAFPITKKQHDEWNKEAYEIK